MGTVLWHPHENKVLGMKKAFWVYSCSTLSMRGTGEVGWVGLEWKRAEKREMFSAFQQEAWHMELLEESLLQSWDVLPGAPFSSSRFTEPCSERQCVSLQSSCCSCQWLLGGAQAMSCPRILVCERAQATNCSRTFVCVNSVTPPDNLLIQICKWANWNMETIN